jgi:hypothetical protein
LGKESADLCADEPECSDGIADAGSRRSAALPAELKAPKILRASLSVDCMTGAAGL